MENVINTERDACGTASQLTEVKERLTLHVKKRLSGDYQIASSKKKKGDSKTNRSCGSGEGSKDKWQKKHGRKPRKKLVHEVMIKTEAGCGSDETVPENPEGCLSEGMEGESNSSEAANDDSLKLSGTPCSTSWSDSFFNNTILNEVLGEKKKAVLESEEVIEYLRRKLTRH